MKIFNVLSFWIMFFLFFVATGWGSDWRFYAITRQGKSYYDTASVKQISKAIVEVWVKNVVVKNSKKQVRIKYNSEESRNLYGDLGYDINLLLINCTDRMMKISQGTTYDQNGDPIMSYKDLTDWHYISPGSTTDSLFQIICKKMDPAANWRSVGKSQFDASRISRVSPSIIRVWEKVQLPEDALEELRKDQAHDYSDYSYTINRKRIDCKKKTIAGAGSTDYNSHGQLIQYFDEKSIRFNDIQALSVAPYSQGEKFIEAVCDYVNKVSKKKKRRR
ncbi:MAG TPA: surface-adhesin E family protein [Chitinispirillaceae bacterium]|nr:surface-adhesin E family protein [Chitinispirillaceae bacterium]